MYFRKYETIVIANPKAGDEGKDKILSRYREALEKTGGKEIRLEEWGSKELAFPIQKEKRGNFYYVLYLGTNETVAEFERLMGITESAMRYQTVLLEDLVKLEDVDFEKEKTLVSLMLSGKARKVVPKVMNSYEEEE